jgi:hypothetical protein
LFELKAVAFPRRVQRQHERHERPQEASDQSRPEAVAAVCEGDEESGNYADREQNDCDESRKRPDSLRGRHCRILHASSPPGPDTR